MGFPEIEESAGPVAYASGSSAHRLEPESVTLRFSLAGADDRALEALRYARRAMLREEWTLGVEEGEPSLDDAVFSSEEVVWSVAAGYRERCRSKLEELLGRARRALEAQNPMLDPGRA